MTGRYRGSDADAIRKIVEAEEQKALARFRSSRFTERLKSSLREQPLIQPRPSRVRPFFRPVWVSLVILIAVGAAATWLLRPRTRAIQSGTVVEAFLHDLPGLQAIENPPRSLSVESFPPRSPLEKDITSVLSGSSVISGPQHPGQSRLLPEIVPRPGPLGLERVYEILVIDRSVERVLTDLSPKT